MIETLEPMPRRIEKVNSHLQREIAVIIDREVELPENALVTVTRVDTSPDLKNAKVFITVLYPGGDEKAVLAAVKANTALIRGKLAPAVTFRFVPEILICEDVALKLEEKMRKLFADIESDVPPAPGGEA